MGRGSVIRDLQGYVLVTESDHLSMQYEFALSPLVKTLFALNKPLELELTLSVSSALTRSIREKVSA